MVAPRNALMPFQLPDAPDINRLMNPLAQGMQTYRQGMQQQFEGERALETERQNKERLQLAKNADGRAGSAALRAEEKATLDRVAGLAQMADAEQDPARRSQIWGSIVSAHPNMASSLDKYGANDPMRGPKFLIAQARGYTDGQDAEFRRAQIGKLNAETKALGQKDAVGEMIIRQLSGDGGQPPAPSAPASPIRPQSFAPPQGMDPNIIQTQAVDPQQPSPAPAQPPAQDLIDTPYGRMTRERAQRLGGSMLLSPQYAAAGKAILDAVGSTKMGKEAGNENDKKELAAIEGLQRVKQIASGFKPEWLTFENKAKQYGVSWADSFEATRKKLPPDMVKDHVDYTMFKRDAIANLTEGIKAATGAAMGIQEEARIRAGLPDPEKDNPAAFEGKLKGVAREYSLTIARTQYLRRNGFQGDGAAASLNLPVGQFSQMIQQRTNQLQQQIMQQNPQANPAQIQQAVKQGLQAEFGLGI